MGILNFVDCLWAGNMLGNSKYGGIKMQENENELNWITNKFQSNFMIKMFFEKWTENRGKNGIGWVKWNGKGN